MQPNDRDLKLRTRAAWIYSGLDQKKLAAEIGLAYGTLKGLLREGGATPTVDHALAIADACDVPAWFILHGWNPPAAEINAERLAHLEARFDELADRYNSYLSEIRAVAERAAADAADAISQANRATAPKTPAKDHPQGRTATDPQ